MSQPIHGTKGEGRMPRLLTPKERRSIFALSSKLSDDTVFTPSRAASALQLTTVTNQTLSNIVRYIDKYWKRGSNTGYKDALHIATQFLMGGNTYTDHVRAMTMRAKALGPVFSAAEQKYVLNNETPVVTDTAMSPRLHFGKIGNVNMQQIIDWNERIVVKMYELSKIINNGVALVELATDVMIGAVLNDMLVMNARYVVSPHMTFQLDWFAGPSVSVKRNPAGPEPKFLFVSTDASQYVVVERADMTLNDFIMTDRVTPQVMRSCLWQLFYTLDAAFETGEYLHGDLHPGNVMVRNLAKEAASPYANKHWMYVRAHKTAGGPGVAVIRDHGDIFVEVIDYGRSRIYCPVPNADGTMVYEETATADNPRVLIGSDQYAKYGIHASQQFMDRSWDMRRLCAYLLLDYDLSRYDPATIAPVTTRFLARNIKELLVVGSNLTYFILFVLDNIGVYRADFASDSLALQYIDFFEARMRSFAKEHLEANRDAILVDRTYVPPHNVAVTMYNLYKAMTKPENGFSIRLEDDLLWLTVGPNPDLAAAGLSPENPRKSHARGSGASTTLSPTGPSMLVVAASSMHRTVSASTLLALPLFYGLESSSSSSPSTFDTDTVLVGLVSAKAGEWKTALGITAPGANDAARLSANLNAPAGASSSSVIGCAVCHKTALGYAVDEQSRPTTAHNIAFCSNMCMNIHTNVIRAVLPY